MPESDFPITSKALSSWRYPLRSSNEGYVVLIPQRDIDTIKSQMMELEYYATRGFWGKLWRAAMTLALRADRFSDPQVNPYHEPT
jgi:hypothetical protein